MPGSYTENADLIVRGAVYTMDAARPRAEALAVRDGKIMAVGDETYVLGLAGPHHRHQHRRRHGLPGIVDVHAHVGFGGQAAAWELRLPPTFGPDEILSIETMITRRSVDPAFPGTLAGRQALRRNAAVMAHTVNAARAAGLGEVTGKLALGMSADFIIVDRNLFTVPVDQIHATEVRETWFAGRLVHDAAARR